MTYNDEKLDVLAIAAHPDDVELACGGIVCKMVDDGYRVGIVDLTRGELGTRGTPELRDQESEHATAILGIHARENLGLPDGNIENNLETRKKLIRSIRRYRPDLLLANAPEDRHPDHGAAARLAIDARFFSGLKKIETRSDGGDVQDPWRPAHLLHYIQAIELEPTFVVDVSATWERRMKAMMAYASQFHTPERERENEPQTFISSSAFKEWIESRAKSLGYRIGAAYGEGLIYHHGPIGVDDIVACLGKDRIA